MQRRIPWPSGKPSARWRARLVEQGSRSSASRGRVRATRSASFAVRRRRRARRACARSRAREPARCSIAGLRSGCLGQRASPERTSPSCTFMAAAPWSRASSMRSSRSEACGSPSPASSRGAPSRTGGSISPRSRALPISSPPRPRRRRAKRSRRPKAGRGRSTSRGARSWSRRRRSPRPASTSPMRPMSQPTQRCRPTLPSPSCSPPLRIISPTAAANGCATVSASSSPDRQTSASRRC